MQNTDGTPHQDAAQRRRQLRRLGFTILGVVLLGALAIPPALAAAGGDDADPHAVQAKTPKEVREKIGHVATKVLDNVDATAAQRAKVDALLDPLATDIANLANEGRALKLSLHQLAMTDKLDPKAAERLRREAVDLFDRATKRALGTYIEVHGILTPEQRQELRETFQRMHKWRGVFHRRGHGFWH